MEKMLRVLLFDLRKLLADDEQSLAHTIVNRATQMAQWSSAFTWRMIQMKCQAAMRPETIREDPIMSDFTPIRLQSPVPRPASEVGE